MEAIKFPKTKDEIGVGSYAMCWYNKIPSMPAKGIDLYYCKVLKMGREYATCEVYHNEEFVEGAMQLKGTFKDVCVADLTTFD